VAVERNGAIDVFNIDGKILWPHLPNVTLKAVDSENSKLLFAGDKKGVVWQRDSQGTRAVGKAPGPIQSLQVSGDGQHIFVEVRHHFWETKLGFAFWKPFQTPSNVGGYAFAHDGSYVAYTHNGLAYRAFSGGKAPELIPNTPDSPYGHVAISRDGSWLALATQSTGGITVLSASDSPSFHGLLYRSATATRLIFWNLPCA